MIKLPFSSFSSFSSFSNFSLPSIQHSSQKPSWWSVLMSVFAAAFGVQSRKNLDRDFSQNRVWPFLLAGIIFAAVLVIVVYLLVSIIAGAR